MPLNLYLVRLDSRHVGYCEPETAIVAALDEWTARIVCQRAYGGTDEHELTWKPDALVDWTREGTTVERIGQALPDAEAGIVELFHSSG